MSNKKRGFAAFSPERLSEVSRKGGSRKVMKGFAKMDPEVRKKIVQKGAANSVKSREKKDEYSPEDQPTTNQ